MQAIYRLLSYWVKTLNTIVVIDPFKLPRIQLDRFSLKYGVQSLESIDVSPPLVAAILRLRETCAMLGNLLDCVCFREIWKVIAMAITRYKPVSAA